MIEYFTLGKYQLHTSVFILKRVTKYGNRIYTGTLTKIHTHLINVYM